MNRAVALRLGAYVGAVALAFGAAFAVGSAVDPVAAADPAPKAGDQPMTGMDQGKDEGTGQGKDQGKGMDEHGSTDSSMPGHQMDAAGAQPPGLAVSQDGYTLSPATTFFQKGTQQLKFTIKGPDGKPVTQYTKTHEKDLHLIVVRRDLSGFRHVHPTRDASGAWSIPFDFTAGGTWRIFTDFQPAGHGKTLTLGSDVNVAGLYLPVPLPEASSVTSTDGYDVTLAGTPTAGKESELTFSVSRNGKPITDLQPYLGAFGHLVSLRSGDLAYLHNHPAQEAKPGDQGGPQIKFGTTFPTASTYSLFLDFQHDGKVHTAEFRVDVTGAAIVPGAVPTSSDESTPHGH